MTFPDENLNDLSAYDYMLPEELIAKEPLPQRDASRLLVLDRETGEVSHRSIRDLPDLLSPGDCLVFNNTKVLPARLFGVRVATGGKWEGLYLGHTPEGEWRLIGQTRGYLKEGEFVELHSSTHGTNNSHNLSGIGPKLQLIRREQDGVGVFKSCDSRPSLEILEEFGTVPLPPYVGRRLADSQDRDRYQTIYATQPGSVAAPTAGLHFSPQLLEHCRERQLAMTDVTLHVGLGTFRPVNVENILEHKMHFEWCQISKETVDIIEATRKTNRKIVSVGTTSLRTLESVATRGSLQAWSGETNLFIHPPYDFQVVDALLTNFHLPKSTLLMLVSAFAGYSQIRKAYHCAIEERYRFFSYGDAMLIL
ncbi:MAG: tRNA preQ1(34) S-adenosylmethionine ribosyltransferase-isomerase QueA [Planctomycetes bacterium]|nr:tRNA preQ1(34) S-adenosylmethionine ribosyltransferase-isomerase QueA [Planctomycetota bacterium]